ncbi:MAG: hypothetical protein SCALA702_27590 [Melioribacteraceae bacterium]|nr:MAG: hypothetical protein SCALA702_27590 [Melioribacteraceae bacterium]
MDDKKLVKDFMVEIELPRDWDKDFMELIPRQRDELEDMLTNGTIDFYSLSLDRSKLWMLMNGESKDVVMDIISDMAMSQFFKVDIHSLMFTRSQNQITATFSLN